MRGYENNSLQTYVKDLILGKKLCTVNHDGVLCQAILVTLVLFTDHLYHVQDEVPL